MLLEMAAARMGKRKAGMKRAGNSSTIMGNKVYTETFSTIEYSSVSIILKNMRVNSKRKM